MNDSKKGETLKDMIQERDKRFMKIGRCLLQQKYYEDEIRQLLNIQMLLCEEINFRQKS